MKKRGGVKEAVTRLWKSPSNRAMLTHEIEEKRKFANRIAKELGWRHQRHNKKSVADVAALATEVGLTRDRLHNKLRGYSALEPEFRKTLARAVVKLRAKKIKEEKLQVSRDKRLWNEAYGILGRKSHS